MSIPKVPNEKAKERFDQLFMDDVENITAFIEWIMNKFGAKEIWDGDKGRTWFVSNRMLDEWKMEDKLHNEMKRKD